MKPEPQSVIDQASFFVRYVQRITWTLACPGLLHTVYQRTMHGVVLAACWEWWSLPWWEDCTTSIPFCTCVTTSCPPNSLYCTLKQTDTHGPHKHTHIAFGRHALADQRAPVRATAHFVWQILACFSSNPRPYFSPNTLLQSGVCLWFRCHFRYDISNDLRVSCLNCLCVCLWCNIS